MSRILQGSTGDKSYMNWCLCAPGSEGFMGNEAMWVRVIGQGLACSSVSSWPLPLVRLWWGHSRGKTGEHFILEYLWVRKTRTKVVIIRRCLKLLGKQDKSKHDMVSALDKGYVCEATVKVFPKKSSNLKNICRPSMVAMHWIPDSGHRVCQIDL